MLLSVSQLPSHRKFHKPDALLLFSVSTLSPFVSQNDAQRTQTAGNMTKCVCYNSCCLRILKSSSVVYPLGQTVSLQYVSVHEKLEQK
jgi:hypothetical protein